MQHIPKAELIRVKSQVEREQWIQRLQELVAGRDVVELALTDPVEIQENPPFQRALLGRACYPDDENNMHILDAEQPWGFTYYKTKEVEEKYGRTWEETWIMINDIPQQSTVRDVSNATWSSIHCQGKRDEFRALQTEDWATPPTYEGLTEEDAFRKHFGEHRKSISSPGILQNTFIVIPIELIPDDPDDDELDPYWVWAYDADWDSSSEGTICNGEKYQGRIKVAVYALKAWFYAARWEGVSHRDMWLKAQTHQDNLWICHSKELEEWDHGPYV
ncbi:hypothetical protein ACKAV7_006986 [Fusarium commune]